jgi:hypothetical protein
VVVPLPGKSLMAARFALEQDRCPASGALILESSATAVSRIGCGVHHEWGGLK